MNQAKTLHEKAAFLAWQPLVRSIAFMWAEISLLTRISLFCYIFKIKVAPIGILHTFVKHSVWDYTVTYLPEWKYSSNNTKMDSRSRQLFLNAIVNECSEDALDPRWGPLQFRFRQFPPEVITKH